MDSTREQRHRRDLMRKGMSLNERLTELLANENMTLSSVEFPHEQKPGLKPKEKVRMFLDQVIRAQRRLGTGAWGLCVTCGGRFDEAMMDDTPWLEECRDCIVGRDEW